MGVERESGCCESGGLVTCVGLEVLGRVHGNKLDGLLVLEDFVRPAADRAHAFHGRDTVVGDEHLFREKPKVVVSLGVGSRSHRETRGTYGLDDAVAAESRDELFGRRGAKVLALLAEFAAEPATVEAGRGRVLLDAIRRFLLVEQGRDGDVGIFRESMNTRHVSIKYVSFSSAVIERGTTSRIQCIKAQS